MGYDENQVAAAEALYRAADYAAAARLLEPLTARDAPSPDGLRIFGLCRLRLGAPEAAVESLAHAYRLAPANPGLSCITASACRRSDAMMRPSGCFDPASRCFPPILRQA
jgi:tetratricopeptide (TPR) repeat protein